LTATNVVNTGNNYYQAIVAEAGNPWEANLSQVTAILADQAYKLTFRAKASVERNILAGIGLNAAPWSASTQDVALTTEWQVIELELTATDVDGAGFGDAAARILFDMGAEAGDVSLDDITLELVL